MNKLFIIWLLILTAFILGSVVRIDRSANMLWKGQLEFNQAVNESGRLDAEFQNLVVKYIQSHP